MSPTTVVERPRASAGTASATMTLVRMVHRVAPRDWAASTSPTGTSRMPISTSRAKKGMPAMVSGTMAAVGPMKDPTSRRVNGMSRIMRMMNGMDRPMFTTTSSTRLTKNPSARLPNELRQQAAGLGGHQQDAGGQAENDREQQAQAHGVERLTGTLEDRVQEVGPEVRVIAVDHLSTSTKSPWERRSATASADGLARRRAARAGCGRSGARGWFPPRHPGSRRRCRACAPAGRSRAGPW